MKKKLFSILIATILVLSFVSTTLATEFNETATLKTESVVESGAQESIAPRVQRTYSTTYPTNQGSSVQVLIPDSQGVYKWVTLYYYGMTADGWYGYAGLYDY